MSNKKIAVIYHTQSSHTEKLAYAFIKGAKHIGQVDTRLLRAEEATVDDLVDSDAWVLLCAENFGEIAGGMKNFLDRAYYPFERASALKNQDGKPYMLVLSAGNDGSFCESKLTRILTGLNARKVQESKIFYGEPTEEALQELEALGEGFATAIEMGAF